MLELVDGRIRVADRYLPNPAVLEDLAQIARRLLPNSHVAILTLHPVALVLLECPLCSGVEGNAQARSPEVK